MNYLTSPVARVQPLYRRDMKALLMLMLFSVQAIQLVADDGSARRYISMQSEPVICKYFLLSGKVVQERLNLTELQIESLECAMTASPTSIVAIAELRQSQRRLMDAAQSDEERLKIRRAGNEKALLIIHENWETVLQHTLSHNQDELLDGLFLQMEGPHIILENSNLVASLGLSTLQVKNMDKISHEYKQFLSLLYHRYIGLQVSPVRKRDEEDLRSEIGSLASVIEQTEKDEDSELLAVLDSDQRLRWNNLCGSPLSINWNLERFTDAPFEGN